MLFVSSVFCNKAICLIFVKFVEITFKYIYLGTFNYSISFRIIKCIFYENVIAGFFEGSFSDFNICTHKNTVNKNKSMAELKYRAEIENKTNFSDSSLAACIHKT